MKVCGLCDLVMASNLQPTKESNDLSWVDGGKGHVGFPIPFMAFKNDFYHHVCQLSSKVVLQNRPTVHGWVE